MADMQAPPPTADITTAKARHEHKVTCPRCTLISTQPKWNRPAAQGMQQPATQHPISYNSGKLTKPGTHSCSARNLSIMDSIVLCTPSNVAEGTSASHATLAQSAMCDTTYSLTLLHPPRASSRPVLRNGFKREHVSAPAKHLMTLSCLMTVTGQNRSQHLPMHGRTFSKFFSALA